MSGLCADFEADASVLGELYGGAVLAAKEARKKVGKNADSGAVDVDAGEKSDNNSFSSGGSGNRPTVVGCPEVSEVHPLVWTHPGTGQKAIISASMWLLRIVEQDGALWSQKRSHDFLYTLLKPVVQTEYAHEWSVGDLVCFDNRSVMHSASPVEPGSSTGRRLLHQIILCGNEIPQGPAGKGVGNPTVNPNVAAVRDMRGTMRAAVELRRRPEDSGGGLVGTA